MNTWDRQTQPASVKSRSPASCSTMWSEPGAESSRGQLLCSLPSQDTATQCSDPWAKGQPKWAAEQLLLSPRRSSPAFVAQKAAGFFSCKCWRTEHPWSWSSSYFWGPSFMQPHGQTLQHLVRYLARDRHNAWMVITEYNQMSLCHRAA